MSASHTWVIHQLLVNAEYTLQRASKGYSLPLKHCNNNWPFATLLAIRTNKESTEIQQIRTAVYYM